MEYGFVNLETAVLISADDVHKRIDDFHEYKKIAEKNKKLKTFLGIAYVWAARWHERNRKFNLKKKIIEAGEDYIGIALGLDDISEGIFPTKYSKEIQIISDLIYGKNFIEKLKRNAREIHEILTREINKPKVYL